MLNFNVNTAQAGDFPKFDGGWTTRTPLWPGKNNVASYTVPAGKTAKIKTISFGGDYQGISRNMGFGRMAIGTVYFQVDGVNKAEFRIQSTGPEWGGAGLGESDLGSNGRRWWTLGAMDFTEGQVIRFLVTPIAVSGLVPQALWRVNLILTDSEGQAVFAKGKTITTTATANQVILSYTVPAGGIRFKSFTCQATAGDFMLGIAQLKINGLTVLELPLMNSALMTKPGINTLNLFDGITFNPGDNISLWVDCPETYGQRYQMTIAGTETDIQQGGSVEWTPQPVMEIGDALFTLSGEFVGHEI